MSYIGYIPTDGFTGHGGPGGYNAKAISSSHNVISTSDYAKVYPLGTVATYFNSAIGGYGACAYLKTDETISGAGLVATLLATSHTEVAVTLSNGMAIGCGPSAVSLSAVTDEYYGWYWIKGVCPDLYTDATTKLSASTISIISGVTLTAGESFFAATAGEIDEYLETDVAIPCGHAINSGSGSGGTIGMGQVKLIGSGWGI